MYAGRVTWGTALVPVAGICIAAAIPLALYGVRDRRERAAIEVMRRIQQAQDAFRDTTGGFASDIASLQVPCVTGAPALADDAVTTLGSVGYSLELRRRRGAVDTGRDCHGRPVVSDYYVAAAPQSATVARQAFAGVGTGRLYLFFDGVAPRERDIDSGLPTPVEARESFKIP